MTTKPKKKAPDLSKVKHTKAKAGTAAWRNKTIDEFEVSENVKWVSQLSISPDGRKYRSLNKMITKRDGTTNRMAGLVMPNESAVKEIKGMIRLLKGLLPKEAP